MTFQWLLLALCAMLSLSGRSFAFEKEVDDGTMVVSYDDRAYSALGCPFCFEFWRSGDIRGDRFFRMFYANAAEINPTERASVDDNLCCTSNFESGCVLDLTNANCKKHGYTFFPTAHFDRTFVGNSTKWGPNLVNADPDATANCAPIGSVIYDLCAGMEASYEYISPGVVQGKLKLFTWTFAPGSTGIQILIRIFSGNQVVERFTVTSADGKEKNPGLPPEPETNFTKLKIVGREADAEFTFPRETVVDGQPSSLHIKGPFDFTAIPTAGREIKIIVPRFSNFWEYKFTFRIFPEEEKEETSANTTSSTFAAFTLVLGVCVGCCLLCWIIHRVQKFLHRAHPGGHHKKWDEDSD